MSPARSVKTVKIVGLDGNIISEMPIDRVLEIEGWTFALHRDIVLSRWWCLTDPKSGMALGNGASTKTEAIHNAKESARLAVARRGTMEKAMEYAYRIAKEKGVKIT